MKSKFITTFIVLLLVLPCVLAQVKVQLGEPYVNIRDTSDIEFTAHSDYYEICSMDKTIIPVLIKNNNRFSDTFNFKVDKEYMSLPVYSAVLKSGKSAILPLTISPPADLVENTILTLDIITEKEGLKRSVKIKADIEECYMFKLEIDKDKDDICGCDNKTYTLILHNNGQYTDTFVFSFDMPEWINSTLTNDTIILYDGQQKEIMLEAEPSCEEKGVFTISAEAVSEETGMVLRDELELNVSPQKTCYNTVITASNVRIDYSGKNIPITITNKGAKDTTYSLDIEGIDWYTLSQTDLLRVKQGEEKTINLALYPGKDIVEGKYNIDVIAKSDSEEVTKSIIVSLNEKEGFGKIGFYLNYSKYYIGAGIALLIVVLLLIFAGKKIIGKIRKRKTKKKKAAKKEVKEKTAEIKKISVKKVNKRKLFEYIYPVLVILLFIAVVGYAIYQFSGKPMPIDKLVVVKNLVGNYLPYFIGGVLVLAALVLFIRKKRKKIKEQKIVKKKIRKKSDKKFIIIIGGLVILSGIVYSFIYYGLISYIRDFFILYYPYVLMGVGMLVILILILHFQSKKIQ